MHVILVCSQLHHEGRKANTEPVPRMAPRQRCCLQSLDPTPHPSWLCYGTGLGWPAQRTASGTSYPQSALGRAWLALTRSYRTVRIESARSQAQVCLGPFDEGEREATVHPLG